MTGEIVKIDKSGKVSRPVHGTTEVVGAAPRHGQTEILDKSTKQEPASADVHVHVENVTTADDIRRANLRENEPEIRIRSLSAEAKKEWEDAKHDA
jgi:uncharacterized Zn finger protein (UPF0148 family)